MAIKIPKRLRDFREYRLNSVAYVLFGHNNGAGLPDAATQADINLLTSSGVSVSRITWIDLGTADSNWSVVAANLTGITTATLADLIGGIGVGSAETVAAVLAGELVGVIPATAATTETTVDAGELSERGAIASSNLVTQVSLDSQQLTGLLNNDNLSIAGILLDSTLLSTDAVAADTLTTDSSIEGHTLAGSAASSDATATSSIDSSSLNGILTASSATAASSLDTLALNGVLTAPSLSTASTCTEATFTGSSPLVAASTASNTFLTVSTLNYSGALDNQWVQGTLASAGEGAQPPSGPGMWLRKQAGSSTGYYVTLVEGYDGDIGAVYDVVVARVAAGVNTGIIIGQNSSFLEIPSVIKVSVTNYTFSMWVDGLLYFDGDDPQTSFGNGTTSNAGATSYTAGVL